MFETSHVLSTPLAENDFVHPLIFPLIGRNGVRTTKSTHFLVQGQQNLCRPYTKFCGLYTISTNEREGEQNHSLHMELCSDFN